jgi:hypothetical protein
VSVVPVTRPGLAARWQAFEAWVGTRRSAAALFVLALAVFAVQSLVLPVQPGRDMYRYVQAYVQLGYEEPILPSVLDTRGPLTALGVSVPLEIGGAAAEIWLALLYAASIVAWGRVALTFGPRTALLTTGLLLVFPGYGILFHGLASDALFAAGFAGWAVLLTRALLKPSVAAFLLVGLGMGALVLIRPANQALVVMALLPLLVRAPWERRLTWSASFFVASAAVTQGWKAVAHLRWDDAVGLNPSNAVIATSLVLCIFFVPAAWRRRLALLAIPLVVAVVALNWSSVRNPVDFVRSAAQGPASDIFLFRAFEVDRIVSPDNGPASQQLARAVESELLDEEPYRSYGIDLDEFFSSGSDRMFVDVASLGGHADLQTVTEEAIREHPWAFAEGIARTVWEMLWTSRVYGPETPEPEPSAEGRGGQDLGVAEVGDENLPRPTEGEPIPSSRVGPAIRGLGGSVREEWHSATGHNLVFEDPRDERRYERFQDQTFRLTGRIPTRDTVDSAVHRLNQASHRFPPPFVWLAIGAVALALRRPRGAFVAIAPALAGLVVVVVTGAVTLAVGEYVVPVTPAFVLLAAAGLLGAHPRGRLRLPRLRRYDSANRVGASSSSSEPA